MQDVLLTTKETEENPELREQLLNLWRNPNPHTTQYTGTSNTSTVAPAKLVGH
jgi:hypothetical protein